MKKIAFLILLMGALISCNETQAQIRMFVSTTGLQANISTTVVADTLNNADSSWFLVPAGQLAKYKSRAITFYFTLDTVSGTTTPGNVVAQGSFDGITWFNLSGGKVTDMSGPGLGIDGSNCDSLTWSILNVSNKVNRLTCIGGTAKYAYSVLQSNNAVFVPYARLKYVSSGTQSTRIYNVYCIPF
jgi:hypothetical protein